MGGNPIVYLERQRCRNVDTLKRKATAYRVLKVLWTLCNEVCCQSFGRQKSVLSKTTESREPKT